MFQPLEWFIGLRYLRSRRRRGVVSFMSAASLIGIALGVAALIAILSVMNGLETETRTRLLSMNAHASLFAPEGGLKDWRALRQRILAEPHVTGASPYVTVEGMLAAGANLRPALVRGVLPAVEQKSSGIDRYLTEGSLEALQPGKRQIILGTVLALDLGLKVGDPVNLLVPRVINGQIAPRYAAFVVVGLFEAGIQDNDANLALIHVEDASDLAGLGGAAEGLAVRLDDPMAVSGFHDAVAGELSSSLKYSDWTEEHRNLFSAIHIEKMMMTIILMFIVAVAAFNIIASLMMVVIDKQKDVAILRTYGLDAKRVARIFLVQGAVIGLVGTLLGTGLGVVLALNIHVIVPWLESTFHFKIMPGDVYYVTQLPSEVHLADVVTIPLVAFVITVLATIYPSRRAAGIAPAAALRYD
jgi:lipoprotein-releasing system permease protein